MLAPARVAAIVALALAGFAAGCGGGDDDGDARAYANAVNTAQTRFADAATRIGRDGEPASSADLRRLGAAVDRVAGDLEAVPPPDEVAVLHRRLVREVREFGDTLRTARRGLASGSRAEILARRATLLRRTRSATRRIDATLTAIDRELQT